MTDFLVAVSDGVNIIAAFVFMVTALRLYFRDRTDDAVFLILMGIFFLLVAILR